MGSGTYPFFFWLFVSYIIKAHQAYNKYSAGAASDIAFVHRVKKCDTGAMIMTTDFLYDSDQDSWFVDLITELSTKQITTSHLFTYDAEDDDKQSLLLSTLSSDALESLAVLPQNCTLQDATNDNNTISQVQQPSTHLYMDDSLSLDAYLTTWLDYFGKKRNGSSSSDKSDVLEVKAYARVGLMGNPSDGFYGNSNTLLFFVLFSWGNGVLRTN